MLTLLYYVQLVLMPISGIAQLILLVKSETGTSLTWIIYWQIFTVINLLLAIRSNQENPDREIQRMIRLYIIWTCVTLTWFAVMLYRGTATWNWADTLNLKIGLVGTAITLVLAYTRNWYHEGNQSLTGILGHPWTRTLLALTFKAMPQVSMGIQLAFGTPNSVATIMLIGGHISIAFRFTQALLTAQKTGFNKNLVAILISEGGNGLSWWFFTYFWLNS